MRSTVLAVLLAATVSTVFAQQPLRCDRACLEGWIDRYMVREAGVPTIFVVRLGVAGQQIAEIETLVIRNQMAAENLDRVARPSYGMGPGWSSWDAAVSSRPRWQ